MAALRLFGALSLCFLVSVVGASNVPVEQFLDQTGTLLTRLAASMAPGFTSCQVASPRCSYNAFFSSIPKTYCSTVAPVFPCPTGRYISAANSVARVDSAMRFTPDGTPIYSALSQLQTEDLFLTNALETAVQPADLTVAVKVYVGTVGGVLRSLPGVVQNPYAMADPVRLKWFTDHMCFSNSSLSTRDNIIFQFPDYSTGVKVVTATAPLWDQSGRLVAVVGADMLASAFSDRQIVMLTRRGRCNNTGPPQARKTCGFALPNGTNAVWCNKDRGSSSTNFLDAQCCSPYMTAVGPALITTAVAILLLVIVTTLFKLYNKPVPAPIKKPEEPKEPKEREPRREPADMPPREASLLASLSHPRRLMQSGHYSVQLDEKTVVQDNGPYLEVESIDMLLPEHNFVPEGVPDTRLHPTPFAEPHDQHARSGIFPGSPAAQSSPPIQDHRTPEPTAVRNWPTFEAPGYGVVHAQPGATVSATPLVSLQPLSRHGIAQCKRFLLANGFPAEHLHRFEANQGKLARGEGFTEELFLKDTVPGTKEGKALGQFLFQLSADPLTGMLNPHDYLYILQTLAAHDDPDCNTIKAHFLFYAFDWDGDGLVRRRDVVAALQYSLRKCKLSLPPEKQDALIDAFMGGQSALDRDLWEARVFPTADARAHCASLFSVIAVQWPVSPQVDFGRAANVSTGSGSGFAVRLIQHWKLLLLVLVYVGVMLGFAIPVIRKYSTAQVVDTFGYAMLFSRVSARLIMANTPLLVLMVDRQLVVLNALNWIAGPLALCLSEEPRALFGFRQFLIDNHVLFHKCIGWMFLPLILIHIFGHVANAAFAAVATEQQLYLSTPSNFPRHPTWPSIAIWSVPAITGWIATFLFGVLFVFASKRFRTRYHHLFFATHRLYLVIFAVLVVHELPYHLDFWMYLVTWPVINFKTIFFGFPIVPLFFLGKLIAIIRRRRAGKVASFKDFGSSIALSVGLEHEFRYKPGDFVWLKIPEISWEWHPFTITSAPAADGYKKLTFHIREARQRCTFPNGVAADSWTVKLARHLREHPPDQGNNTSVRVDGPYAAPSRFISRTRGDSNLILIGQGVGVTPFASILKDITSDATNSWHPAKRLVFVWVSPDWKNFQWFTDVLAAAQATTFIDLVIYNSSVKDNLEGAIFKTLHQFYAHCNNGKDILTGLRQPMRFGRPKWDVFFRELVINPNFTTPVFEVFMCGSKEFVEEVEKPVEQLNILETARELEHRRNGHVYERRVFQCFSENF